MPVQERHVTSGDQTGRVKARPQLRPEQGQRLQHGCNIRSRKVHSDIEQRTVPRFGDFIGEAVAEVQSSGVDAFTPLRVGIGNLPRCGWRDACDFKIESVEKRTHFGTKASPFRDD